MRTLRVCAFSSLVLLCGWALTPRSLAVQSADSVLQPLSFLSGRWTAESAGESEEEYWSKAMGSSMVGSFRVMKAGEPVFYEFWVIEVENGQVVFKMKHFNAGLRGWEEKNDVVRLLMSVKGRQEVVFANADDSLNLRYVRTGEELTGELRRVKDAKTVTDTFHFHRAD